MRLLAAVKNIGIERLGEPNIRKMMSILGVKDLNDIFKLKITDIMKLDGFQALSATNLYNESLLSAPWRSWNRPRQSPAETGRRSRNRQVHSRAPPPVSRNRNVFPASCR